MDRNKWIILALATAVLLLLGVVLQEKKQDQNKAKTQKIVAYADVSDREMIVAREFYEDAEALPADLSDDDGIHTLHIQSYMPNFKPKVETGCVKDVSGKKELLSAYTVLACGYKVEQGTFNEDNNFLEDYRLECAPEPNTIQLWSVDFTDQEFAEADIDYEVLGMASSNRGYLWGDWETTCLAKDSARIKLPKDFFSEELIPNKEDFALDKQIEKEAREVFANAQKAIAADEDLAYGNLRIKSRGLPISIDDDIDEKLIPGEFEVSEIGGLNLRVLSPSLTRVMYCLKESAGEPVLIKGTMEKPCAPSKVVL